MQVVEPHIDKVDERICTLKEKLKTIEGHETHGLDAFNMCLMSGLVIPPKFKVPYFERYKGINCPKTHLRAYYIKMSTYSDNDKLLIHYFQDSLSGASLEWYM